jgi:hypothetical protein
MLVLECHYAGLAIGVRHTIHRGNLRENAGAVPVHRNPGAAPMSIFGKRMAHLVKQGGQIGLRCLLRTRLGSVMPSVSRIPSVDCLRHHISVVGAAFIDVS